MNNITLILLSLLLELTFASTTESTLKALAEVPVSIDEVVVSILPTPETLALSPDGLHSLLGSLSMIIISELGDKTFLVAALLSMKHDRVVVFFGAFSALFLMSVLSALLGHTMPSLLPKWTTQLAACGLFLVFGARMCYEGYYMSSDASVHEEMAEVEHELEVNLVDDHQEYRKAEEGKMNKPNRITNSPVSGDSEFVNTGISNYIIDSLKSLTDGTKNLLVLLFSQVFLQTFTLTFLGEWGDRSQIATIAMAAGSDYWLVICGTVLGHAICTILAVIGGRLLASKISVRTVTLSGGSLFLLFGIVYAFGLINDSS